MAYLDQKRMARSPVTMIVVATLEVAAIFAIVRGLIVDVRPQAPPHRIIADNIKLTPPTPLPSEKPKVHEPVIRESKQPLAPVTHPSLFKPGPLIIDQGPIAPPSPDPVELIPLPRPSPSPGLAPRFARPRGSSANWATTADYPGSDLRQGNQGLVRFSLTVGADGKVSACVVTRSSGFPGLDEATCDKVSSRARFEPATDASGAKVTGSYAGSVRWVIPE
jgi:periplasmic protein TonB